MKILKHRLYLQDNLAAPFLATPNVGGALSPEVLILHYTTGSSAESSISWLRNPQAAASAHLVIARDGAVTQLVPFNRIAWHAGKSRWDGRDGLNSFSIGIELDNAGKMERVGNRWVGAVTKKTYPDEEVLLAVHKHARPGSPPVGWHEYTEAQLAAAFEVSSLLMGHYGLRDALGHEDVAPGRKEDPGPAFPMASFRARLLGRRDDAPEMFVISTAVNIRSGPGTEHPTLPGSPLPAGTRVAVEEKQAVWWKVELASPSNDEAVEGWIHSKFLQAEA
jgi:N-acetylmuramoyl-L-alanine amidase